MNHQPQAFPKPYNGQPGMDLRDFFAAMAMQAEVASDSWLGDIKRTVTQSYAIADAMLEARE